MKAYSMIGLLLLAVAKPPHAITNAAIVQVTNQSIEAVNVSLKMHGEEYTLGSVERNKTHAFALPAEAVGNEFTVVATPVSGAGFTSQPITLDAGARAQLIVAKKAADSRLTTQ